MENAIAKKPGVITHKECAEFFILYCMLHGSLYNSVYTLQSSDNILSSKNGNLPPECVEVHGSFQFDYMDTKWENGDKQFTVIILFTGTELINMY